MSKTNTSSPPPPTRLGRSAAARLCGVSVELIDYYANTRRLPYVTNATGHREYSELDLRKLKVQREQRPRRIRGIGRAADVA